MDSKRRLREHIAAEQRRRRTAGDAVVSPDLTAFLRDILEQSSPTAVAAFMPIRGEVNIRPFLRETLARNAVVWLPRYHRERMDYDMVAIRRLPADVIIGAFGIEEPLPGLRAIPESERRKESVLWLVPGVAFDRNGHRLGRGKGYYDRLLADVAGVRVGVCWDWQLVCRVPAGAHDVSMHRVVTDRRMIQCDRSAAADGGAAERHGRNDAE